MSRHYGGLRLFPALLLLLCSPPLIADDGFHDEFAWPPVFVHTCENPRLQLILNIYPAQSAGWQELAAGSGVCLIGNRIFTTASVYLSLRPYTGVDEFWILDGAVDPGSAGFPDPLIRLKRHADTLEIRTIWNGETHHHLCERVDESRLELLITTKRLRIRTWACGRADSLERDSPLIDIVTPYGVYLAISCSADERLPCGPVLLDIRMPSSPAAPWSLNLAEAWLRTGNTDLHDAVCENDDWSTIAYRQYFSLLFRLFAAAANPDAGVEPRVGNQLLVSDPRDLLPSERAVLQVIEVEGLLHHARQLYDRHMPSVASAIIEAPRVVGDPGLEGRAPLQLGAETREGMAKIDRLVRAAADSLVAFAAEYGAAPVRAVGQLRQAATIAERISAGANDGYGYDLDMIRQHLDLADRYLIIWAQDGFR